MKFNTYTAPESELIILSTEEGFLTLSGGSGGANGSAMDNDDSTFDTWD